MVASVQMVSFQGVETRPVEGESSATVVARVLAARDRQQVRFDGHGAPSGIRLNVQVDGELLEKIAATDDAGRKLLERAVDWMHLTARGYNRVLRAFRTLADLSGAEFVTSPHMAAAISFRRMHPTAMHMVA